MSLKNTLEASLNEKDIENVYRSEFLKLKKHYPDLKIDSPFGSDGVLTFEDKKTLLEFKYDKNLKSKLTQCDVLIQCLYYLKKFEDAGEKYPDTVFVGDKNECFAIHFNSISKYLKENVDWSIAPSSAHKNNSELLSVMAGDSHISPFVFDITEGFKFETAFNKIKELSGELLSKVKVTKNNITAIFDYFQENVLTVKTKLTTNERANLFIQFIINSKENYLHPKKKNVAITKAFGEVDLNSNLFDSFFSHFEGDKYSPKEKEVLTALVDRLIEDTTRRSKGEFFTPTLFVNLAHDYISKTFGDDWKERFVVIDVAAGTLNLTRDYKFKELYCSTLEQSDLDTAEQMGYNPEAIKFQYDFLNDGYDKLPESLQRVLSGDDNREILFLINPPYATAGNLKFKDDKKTGVQNTEVGDLMKKEGWGAASQNLYAQFLYKIAKYRDLNKNIKVAIFCPPLFLSGGSYKKFREKFLSRFGYECGFLFQASHFSNVSAEWGISLSIFSGDKNETKNEFNFDVYDINNDTFSLEKVGEKIVYNLDNSLKASEWVRQEIKGLKTFDIPCVSSALNVKDSIKSIGKSVENSLGYFYNSNNNVNKNAQNVSLFSTSFADAHGLSIIKENLLKCTSLFTARKTISCNWINSKDEYLAPNEQHENYRQFEVDSLIYSLFHSGSNQSSLRQVDYKDKKWDIKNEFFWMSKDEIQQLANDNSYDELYKDARTSDERFVYKKLFEEGIYDNLSPDAKEVLDMATELLKNSIEMRKLVSESHPEYHLDSWDAGYAQLRLVWKQYFKDEYKVFRDKYKAFENDLRPLVYELGFLRS